MRIAKWCDDQGLPSQEGVQQAVEAERSARFNRRQFLAGAAAVAATAALPRRARAGAKVLDVGIVGAGLAGLVCADNLKTGGTTAKVYEASDRPGGRCYSLRGFFPGQVAERGGELIDNLHKTMLAYANKFNLAKEDYEKEAGETTYFFNGAHYPESAVVDEYRAFVAAMTNDLQSLSGAPSADVHTAADVALDNMSMAQYLDSRGAGPLLREVLDAAYVAEYGLELDQQSPLGFLMFIHADKRSRFMPFGVFSDERYHLVGGNDAIASGIAGTLPGQIEYGSTLVRVRKTAAGRIELTLRQGTKTVTRTHDYAVLSLPFSVLRNVELDASLGLPPWKTKAINELGYGTNAKMMIGFNGPYWEQLGSKGASYSDLPNHQNTWETSSAQATTARAVLTDYSSGLRGARLDPTKVQTEAARFLGDLDKVWPGAKARATVSGGKYVAFLQHWPSNPLALGSYTCYKPGQFTTIAGNEGKPVGNLLFAGEHTNSFYDCQGFMEGACLSGADAALALLK